MSPRLPKFPKLKTEHLFNGSTVAQQSKEVPGSERHFDNNFAAINVSKFGWISWSLEICQSQPRNGCVIQHGNTERGVLFRSQRLHHVILLQLQKRTPNAFLTRAFVRTRGRSVPSTAAESDPAIE
ncbi:uncharacterized protein M6D78_013497 [Vipera latastei]